MSSLLNSLKQLAVAAGVGEDTKIQFSMKPSAGESGFQQWHGAMKMVARLSGGIPHEFRKTLWLTLAERYISSKNIHWSHVERTCFNDSTNPDDEELGVQIVKDLHRTGCSLFCGTSGEENQAILKRVLLAYARWNKSVGYCQGFNMLAALILEVMDRCEYYSLKVMIYLIEGVLPESYFVNSLRGLSVDMAVFRDLLRLKLPELSKHLDALQTDSNEAGNTYEPPLTNVFTMQWFLTLFCNCLPHSTVLRVWDLVFLEGNQVLLKTALAIWDTLSDRIMSVKSADEFYSIMGVLTREMLEFGLMDANSLIKTITSIELSELTELRERYIYNITPWTQVARKGLRLFYSDDESDDSDEDQNDDKVSEGAYGFLKVATKHGSQSIRNISSASILGPLASEKDKIASDISALKKQYSKIKERQRQAQIIFTAACNAHGLMGSVVSSTPAPAINHLLLNKSSINTSKLPKNQKAPVPVSRAVQRLKESSSISLAEDTPEDQGETVYWDERMKKKRKRRRTEISFQRNCCDTTKSENHADSDTSSTSTTSSFKSSSSTELCDEMAEFDSEDANTSISECCSSPHYRMYSSNIKGHSDNEKTCENYEFTGKYDQPHTRQNLLLDTSRYASSDNINENSNLFDPNRERILSALLTTSIIGNECLNKQEDQNESIIEQIQIDELVDVLVEPKIKLDTFMENEDICDSNRKVDLSTCDKNNEIFTSFDRINHTEDVDSTIAQCEDWNETINVDVNSNLEQMKMGALEILFSSSTLESIRTETHGKEKQECFDDKKMTNDVGTQSTISASETNETTFMFSLNKETEMALRKILHENMEVLKKVNQTYVSFESQGFDTADFLNEVDSFSVNYISDEEEDFHPKSDNCSADNQNFKGVDNGNEMVREVGITNDEKVGRFYFVNTEKNTDDENFPMENFNDKVDFAIDDDFKLRDSRQMTNTSGNKNGELGLEIIEFENSAKSSDLIDFLASESNGEDLNQSRNVKSPLGERLENFTFDDYSKMTNFDDIGDLCIENNLKPTLHLGMENSCKCETDDENEITKRGCTRKKYKSLDNLCIKSKPKLKIGLVSRTGKWISISIDNSDLVILNKLPVDNLTNNLSLSDDSEISDEVPDFDYADVDGAYDDVEANACEKFKFTNHIGSVQNTETSNRIDAPIDPYLHMNFDIIATGKKKKNPIEEYMHKKNILSQTYKSPVLNDSSFNPFPARPNNRVPKELGVKLGLYSSIKK